MKKKIQVNSPEYRALVTSLLGREVKFEDVPKIEIKKSPKSPPKKNKMDVSNFSITEEELKNMDMKKFQLILLSVLDYLHKDQKVGEEKIYVNREMDNNQTKFERLGNDDLLGVKSKNPDEAAFILNLLRLKIDRNAYPLIGVFENEMSDANTKTINLDLKKLSALLSEINDIDTIEPVETEIWDHDMIKNWLRKDFLSGKYTGLGGIRFNKDLK